MLSAMKNSMLVIIVVAFFSVALAECPLADLTGDCFVDFEDLGVIGAQWLNMYNWSDLDTLSNQWLTGLNMEWVYVDDPGVDDDGDGIPDHPSFAGHVSKYETTNAQYCEFLNAALASNDITVSNGTVYGAEGPNTGEDFVGEPYLDTYAANEASQITYSDGTFGVRSRDGYDMNDHPVVMVSWWGATAFCNYYGWRLPNEHALEWQAIADYDGSYTYGCGTTIDDSKANYNLHNPLGLSSAPYTTPVGYYPAFGYGLCDIAGNVYEWTWITTGGYKYLYGGCWDSDEHFCCVEARIGWSDPDHREACIGFRSCR